MAGANTDLENLYQQQDTSPQENKPGSPPPSYGDIPGVVPFRQGGGVGPPPTYEEANDPTVEPPSYDSLYGKVREAHKSSTGVLDFLKKLIILILGTIGCTIMLGITVIIPVAMIVIGSIHIHDCPVEPYIPIYLIVGGCFGVFKNLMNFCNRCRSRDDEGDEDRLRSSPVDTIITCFLSGWFIAGCVWIYRVYKPEFEKNEQNLQHYCNKELYLFAFWLVTSAYIILGILSACLCCISIASVTIHSE